MRPQLVDMLVRLLQTLRAILVTLKELREIMKQIVTWAKLKELVTRFFRRVYSRPHLPRGQSVKMVEDMKSIPVQDSVAFLRLRDHYKNDLLEDSRLNKAAELAATHTLY